MYLLPKKIMGALTPEQLKEVREYLKKDFIKNNVQSIQLTDNLDNIFVHRGTFLTDDLLICTSLNERTIYIHLTDQKEWQATHLDNEIYLYTKIKRYIERVMQSEIDTQREVDVIENIEIAFRKAVDDLANQFPPESHLTGNEIAHDPLVNGFAAFTDEKHVEHRFFLDTRVDTSGKYLIMTFSYKHNDKPVRQFAQMTIPIRTFNGN